MPCTESALKRCLTYFFVALIALQSLLLAADSHRLVQDENQHLVAEHFHFQHGHLLTSDIDLEQPTDCQHCCHCHGHATPALVPSTLNIRIIYSYISLSPYTLQLAPSRPELLLRPPIV